MAPNRIPVFRPLLEQEEQAAAREALDGGWLGMGGYVGRFEQQLRELLGTEDRHVVAVNTGHAALHLALLVAGVGPGDEVITPSFNNIADFQAIVATGARPVFCDIDRETLCLDVDAARALVRDRVKAVIAMDYGCCLCDHDRVAEFAAEARLRVIHDASHSLYSTYKGRMVGSFSDICIFSFDPVKTITAIDGGALVVRSPAEVQELHERRLIGMHQPAEVMYKNQRAWTYDVTRLGFRYHMANLHAAVGLAQLEKLDRIVATRRATCERYNTGFATLEKVIVPRADFGEVAPFLYYIRVPPDERDRLREHMQARGIDTGVHWQPGHWFTLLRDCRRGDLSVTEDVGRSIVSLPLHSAMPGEDSERVIEAVTTFFA